MIAFIVNPESGNGRGAKVWREIEVALKQHNVKYSVSFTTCAGDGRRQTVQMLQADASDLPAIIAAVGGDGTVNEVVNGFFEAGKTNDQEIHKIKGYPIPLSCRFAFIPAGSGNDYARGHGIPLNPMEALKLLLSEHQGDSYIDLIQIGNQVAVSSIGCGLDGQVAKTTNEAGYKKMLNRIRFGKLAYVISLVSVLTTYRPSDAMLRIDGCEVHLSKVWLICIANIPYYGGGMKICPNAVPNDGLAEICIVSGISRWSLLLVFPLVYSGKHVTHPAASFYSGKSIEIVSSKPLVTHTDGEVITGDIPLHIQVIPGLLSIVAN